LAVELRVLGDGVVGLEVLLALGKAAAVAPKIWFVPDPMGWRFVGASPGHSV
jgi:hypothetical protein